MTIVPRQGRDFRSRNDVSRAFYADTDFQVADISSPWDGKPVNFSDLQSAGHTKVWIRYAKLRRITALPINPLTPTNA
jgi:hypothetical protein